MQADLSIIIPHYNSPQYLKSLLESIGVHEDVEVIVVDDYSSERISEYTDLKRIYANRVKFLSNDGTKSAGAARNIGLKAARGHWLLFADADDYFLPQWYDNVKKFFTSGYDIVFFKPTSINLFTGENGERANIYIELIDRYKVHKKNSEEQLKYNWVVPWSKLINRTIIEKNNIDFEETLHSNDVMFSIRLAYYAKSISVSNDNIYCVTTGASILTVDSSKQAQIVRVGVLCRRYLFLKSHGIEPQYWTPLLRLRSVYKTIGKEAAKAVLQEYKKYNVPLFTFKMLLHMRPIWDIICEKIKRFMKK